MYGKKLRVRVAKKLYLTLISRNLFRNGCNERKNRSLLLGIRPKNSVFIHTMPFRMFPAHWIIWNMVDFSHVELRGQVITNYKWQAYILESFVSIKNHRIKKWYCKFLNWCMHGKPHNDDEDYNKTGRFNSINECATSGRPIIYIPPTSEVYYSFREGEELVRHGDWI